MSHHKYPRTYHLPWSLGTTSDDRFMHDTTPFHGKQVIVTEKMDGENTNMYSDRIHARSLDSLDHDSRHWVKGLWGQIKHEIPDGWRFCGENLFAKHSIFYEELPTYFMLFSVWNEENKCLSWSETEDIAGMLGLQTVPVMAKMEYNEDYLKKLANTMDLNQKEGFVVRDADGFAYEDFAQHVAKWVRAKHVQTDKHWMTQMIIPNKLKQ